MGPSLCASEGPFFPIIIIFLGVTGWGWGEGEVDQAFKPCQVAIKVFIASMRTKCAVPPFSVEIPWFPIHSQADLIVLLDARKFH